MDAQARLTSKGQVTIPKTVRDALGLEEGDQVLFRVEDSRAVLAKTPDFLELAGSVPVPAGKRGTPWDEIVETAWRQQTRRSR
ncbi:MAG: AbrB/MazE/SpoVT family DNA-binding domain-containing protein [Solirubrobacterales bacterium]